jgi:uncharacterized protein (TIGR02171 family)
MLRLKQLRHFLWNPSLFVLLHCLSNSPNQTKPDITYNGMRIIEAKGKTFIQGATDVQASEDEKPPMTSTFTYNYWIDTIEITQKEYAEITGKQPVHDTSSNGVGERNPVYYVSWFDAILFCNAKSKNAGLDTVYSYSGMPKMQATVVIDLIDVHIHYDRDGYRLPTEAEWEYAAREGTSQIPFPHLRDSIEVKSYAWYAANASGQTHPVATCLSNAFGLYDMAGNVFEWTGDWKGYYPNSPQTNSIGVQFPNPENERVIKGGSFSTGFSSLRPSHRSGIYGYPTSQPTAVSYIGFRCARGVISSPSFLSESASSVLTNPTNLQVGNVIGFLGTSRARVVFINVTKNLRTLCYVDFSRNYPYVYEFKDIDTVFTPVISPNGKYVAFCNRDEGASGAATVFIRSLDSFTVKPSKLPTESAYVPRWWVDQTARDTFLIFTNSTVDNSTELWPSTRTFLIKMSGSSPVGSPQEIVSSGSYHDGRSFNGQYIVTGFTKLIMRDLLNREERQLFMAPFNGKGLLASTQVCNVSICPDSAYNDRCLFLDFGCLPPAISTLTGTSYGIHEYLFVNEYSGNVLSWFKCPEGERSWAYPEWSNVGTFAVACALNTADASHSIYLVNLHSSAYFEIIQGTELVHPFLWLDPKNVKNSDSLNLDSLGNYNDPPLLYNLSHFSKRMHEFWQKRKDMEIVFVGSSHTANGIDPNYFTNNKVYNMAFSGCPFIVTLTIINNYLLYHCPSIKMIACDIIPATLFWQGYFTIWSPIEPNKGYNYDKNHQFWKIGLPSNFEALMGQSPCPNLPSLDTLGLDRSTTCVGWGGGNPDLPAPEALILTTDNPLYKKNFTLFTELIRALAGRKIHFLFYITPESPFYKNTASFGLYGPGWETGKAVVKQIVSLQDSFPGYAHFYDAYLNGNHDYTDEEAANFDHLCPAGAKKLSIRIDSLINVILNH